MPIFGDQVSFTYPGYDYAAEESAIQRRQALANVLQQQALQPLQGQVAPGGWAVPISPFQGLAQLAQAGLSGYAQNKAFQGQQALAQKAQADTRAALKSGLLGTGVPQESIDSIAALATNPMTQSLMPTAIQYAQQQRMIHMLPTLLANLRGQPSAPQQPLQPVQQATGSGYAPQNVQTALSAGGGPTVENEQRLQALQAQTPQPAQQPQGGGIPSLPGADLMLAGGLVGMPALTTLGEKQFEAAKGIAQRPGAPIVNPFTGETMAPAPPQAPEGVGLKRVGDHYEYYQIPQSGLVPQMAGQVAGAQAGARAPFEVHPVTAASGAQMPLYGGSLLNLPGWPTPMQQQNFLQRGVPPPVSRGTPIPQPGQIPSAPAAPQPIQPQGGGSGPAAITPLPGIPPTGVGTSIAGQTAGGRQPLAPPAAGTPQNLPPDPWQTMPKLQTPTGFGQSTYQKGFAEAQAKIVGELYTKYNQQASDADQRLATTNQALDLVDKADVGPGASLITGLKSFLVERLGIPEEDFKHTPSAQIALGKDLNNAAIQQGRKYFQRFTTSEVFLMLNRASPGPEQTRTALKFLLQTEAAKAQYDKQQAIDFGTYLRRGGDPGLFGQWYPGAFPLSNVVSQIRLGGAQGAQVGAPRPGVPVGGGAVTNWQDLK